jgi:hypothetical protein
MTLGPEHSCITCLAMGICFYCIVPVTVDFSSKFAFRITVLVWISQNFAETKLVIPYWYDMFFSFVECSNLLFNMGWGVILELYHRHQNHTVLRPGLLGNRLCRE